MTEAKFTPGPWKICRSNEDFDGPFYGLDDDDYERPINAIRSKSETIAVAHDLFEFNKANAHLIAAAPELYEALEKIRHWGESQHKAQSKGGHATFDMMMLREQIDTAKAALEKARGESHD